MLQEEFHHCRRAADVVQVFHHETAARFQIGEERHAVADGLEIVQGQIDIDGTGHGDQVQHGIGRAAERHHHDHGVFKRRAGHDVARFDILLQQHRGSLCPLPRIRPASRLIRPGRRRCRAGSCPALRWRGHRVGRVHAAAGARAGAALAHDLLPFFVADGAGEIFAVALEGGDDVQFVMFGRAAGADGAAVDHDRRPIEPAHGHDAAGHVFVAAGEAMRRRTIARP
jgi:hypothetical protein